MTELSDAFRALGDPLRFRVVDALFDGPKTVSQLVELLSAPQPNVSRHLKTLRESGLIRPERDGKWVHYALEANMIEELRHWLSRGAGATAGARSAQAADRGGKFRKALPSREDSFLFGG